jgi:short-subunit dehydrogenase
MRVLVVTGASSGVGWALAIRAARAGYAVYAVGRNVGALDALRAKIEDEQGIVRVDATDISIAANAAGLVARALAAFGAINVLVNNAGFASAGPLVQQPDAELERQFGTHVIGPIAIVREALGALRTTRGHVFMIGSGVARIPIGGLGAYPPAKAALRSATTILRRELAPERIAVTYVDPGAIDTPFMRRAGMPGAPRPLLVSPETVARKILVAVGERPRELNAVGWQTAIVALAERFPRITDALMASAPGLVGGAAPSAAARNAGTTARAPLAPAVDATSSDGVAISDRPEMDDDTAASHAAASSVIAAVSEVAAVSDVSASSVIAAVPGVAAVPAASAEPAGPSSFDDARPASVGPQARVPADAFEAALEPHQRRMDKLNFRADFVRQLLVPGARIDPGDVALRWAGMPNKNERAITDDVLAALAAAGFLERTDDAGYRVVRSAVGGTPANPTAGFDDDGITSTMPPPPSAGTPAS